MNSPRSIAMVLSAALALCSVFPQPAVAQTLTQDAQVPAAGLARILIEGGNGAARIVTGADETVRIEVKLSPKQWSDEKPFRVIRDWFLSSPYDDIEDLMGAIRIATETRGDGELRVELTPGGSGREDRVAEEWTVTVPARFAVALHMNSASMNVSGVSGGVEVRAGHGSVDVDVPGGDLDIHLTVGDATVASGSRSVGNIDLESTVGSTRLWLNGLRVKYANPPGPGSRVSASGRGDDVVRVDVEVGDISADVGGHGAAG